MHPFIHRFKTESNNYVYDVHTNEIIQVNEVVFEIIESYNEKEKELLIKKFSDRFDPITLKRALASIKRARERYNLFRSDRPRHKIIVYNQETLKQSFNKDLQVLTLGITENCNLNCSYCVYSGQYKKRRIHSNRNMAFSTARKAVEYLRGYNRPGTNPPGIGFYGGEPLLRFPFIKKVTEYAKKIFPQDMLGFTITTNGTILTNEMLDFFEKNAFYLLISLDGPQKYHDRERRFKNDKGSWNRVIKNLEKIKEEYPEITRHRLTLSVTISSPASYKELDNFFGKIGVTQRIGLVEMTSAENYEQFKYLTDYDYVLEKFKVSGILDQLNDKWNHPENLFVYNLFDEAIMKLHKRNDHPIRLDMPAKHGLCIPGGFKLFVGADGTLFPCEKLEGYPQMRIGHVNHGIDVDRVKRLFDDFRNLDWKDCEDCWVVRFCPCCFLHPSSEGKFNNEKLKVMCNIWRNHYHRMIKTYCSILEKNENAFDYLDNKDISVIPEISNA